MNQISVSSPACFETTRKQVIFGRRIFDIAPDCQHNHSNVICTYGSTNEKQWREGQSWVSSLARANLGFCQVGKAHTTLLEQERRLDRTLLILNLVHGLEFLTSVCFRSSSSSSITTITTANQTDQPHFAMNTSGPSTRAYE